MGIIEFLHDRNSAVLSDKTIMNYNRRGILIEQPIKKEQLQPNSVDLTLGDTYKVLKSNAVIPEVGMLGNHKYCKNVIECIDVRKEIMYEHGVIKDSIIIHPGKFVLLASNEILNIPNGILSFVQGRSSVARIGIQTEQAGLIDSGFRGTITFEVFNETEYPIVLYKGMRVAQVYFFRAEYAKQLYGAKNKGSKYYSQIEATGSKINMDREFNLSYKTIDIPEK